MQGTRATQCVDAPGFFRVGGFAEREAVSVGGSKEIGEEAGMDTLTRSGEQDHAKEQFQRESR